METIAQANVARDAARRYPRVRPVTPFGCSLSSVGGRWWFRKPVRDVGLVYDVSPHGVCVSTEASIKLGEQVSLTLRFAKGTPPAEVAVATVCWTNHPFYGLAFGSISESSLRQLTAYVNASRMEDE